MNDVFSYIFNDTTHTDTSLDYMTNLGMDESAQHAVLSLRDYELSQNGKKRREAYEKYSDPLFLEWQYEMAIGNKEAETYKAAWLNSKEQIKEQFKTKP